MRSRHSRKPYKEDHYPIKRVLAFLFAQGRRTIEKSGGIWYNNKNKQRVLVYGK